MSDTLEKFRNITKYYDPIAQKDWVQGSDYTALLAVAEEQQANTVLDESKIIDLTVRVEASEAKLAAMEEVVEAATRLANMHGPLAYGEHGHRECQTCQVDVSPEQELVHGNDPDVGLPCPVGIVLSFTKNREAGR